MYPRRSGAGRPASGVAAPDPPSGSRRAMFSALERPRSSCQARGHRPGPGGDRVRPRRQGPLCQPQFPGRARLQPRRDRGQHHSLFVDPATARRRLPAFWDKLGRGEFDAGQYKRIGKGGREVWIQASYNPILDAARQAGQGGQVRHRYHRRQARGRRFRRPARRHRQGAGGDRVRARRHRSRRQRELPRRARLYPGRDQGPAPQPVRRARLPRQRRLPRVLGRRSAAASIDAGQYKRIGKGGRSLDPGLLQPDPRRRTAGPSRS